MSDIFQEINDDNLEDFMAGSDGMLLFYKALRPHCKAVKKVIERYAGVNPDVSLAQIDSENNPGAIAALSAETYLREQRAREFGQS